jgi:hypothetical protein
MVASWRGRILFTIEILVWENVLYEAPPLYGGAFVLIVAFATLIELAPVGLDGGEEARGDGLFLEQGRVFVGLGT